MQRAAAAISSGAPEAFCTHLGENKYIQNKNVISSGAPRSLLHAAERKKTQKKCHILRSPPKPSARARERNIEGKMRENKMACRTVHPRPLPPS